MGNKSRSGSGMNIPDPIFESFGVKILKCFDADPDPGSGIFLNLVPGSGIRDGKIKIQDTHPGSATLHLRVKIYSEYNFLRFDFTFLRSYTVTCERY